MKYLGELLHHRDPSRVLWYARGGHAITAGTMARTFSSISPAEWHGRRVALGEMSSLELARTLVLLDGAAECIFFVPLEQGKSFQQAYLKDLRIDVVFGEDAARPDMLIGGQQTTSANPAYTHFGAAIETHWILPTSGTTGVPKLIRHTLATLTRGMSVRDLGEVYVWGSLYNPRRFAGLQVFLQSWLSGTPLILDCKFDISPEYVRRLATLGCNALSATPSMWRKLAMCPGFESIPLKQITLGGEMADQPILDLLKRSFPDARITHIYASTEAGVGFAVNDGRAGFPASYLDVRPGQVAMRVDETGRLWLRPDSHAPTEIGVEDDASGGWIDSGDMVERRKGRIHFLGRASGSINVGGNKVIPEEVEAVIKEVQGVAFAVVKGRKNALMGNLVEAHVSAIEGVVFDDQFKRRITDHCRSRLDAFKVPAFVKPMNGIELTAVGKISRKEVR